MQIQAKIISPVTPQIIYKGVSPADMKTKTIVPSWKQNETKQTFESHYLFYNSETDSRFWLHTEKFYQAKPCQMIIKTKTNQEFSWTTPPMQVALQSIMLSLDLLRWHHHMIEAFHKEP